MTVKSEKENGIGWILIDHPPVNALSLDVVEGILERLTEWESDPEVRVIVVTAAGRTFVAGADVKHFQKLIENGECEKGAGLYEVTNRLEACPKPTVCAIFGTTLGGGLELAMACHYRIASVGTRIGQPEVKLGLIPGAGGTQRLPRLSGVIKAAEMCGLGEMIGVEEAKALGIVDEVVSSDLRVAAGEFALRVSNDGPRRTSEMQDKLELTTETQHQLNEIRRQSLEKFQGARAGFQAIDAIEKSVDLTFEDGLAIENDLFVKALESEDARNLIYLFFAERQAAKIKGLDPQQEYRPADTIGFLQLFADDMQLVEELLRAEIPLKIVDDECEVDFLCVSEISSKLKSLAEIGMNSSPIILVTAEHFQVDEFVQLGLDPAQVVGLRLWANGSRFCEIGTTEDTTYYAIQSVVKLVRQMGCSYVIERPSPFYASSRIKEHRFDESDLKIEVWKLLQENVVQRASDLDLVQVNCFGQPRHKATIGLEHEANSVKE